MDCITQENVTFFNAYNYVTCRLGLNANIFYIEWDHRNKQLDDIMSLDSSMRDEGKYYNHFWVDELKRAIGWIPGNCIYIRSCSVYNGRFHIKIKKEPNDIYAYEQIDEDGYLRLRKFDEERGYYSELEIVDCLYNTSLNKIL
jgi:hypothetical protein